MRICRQREKGQGDLHGGATQILCSAPSPTAPPSSSAHRSSPCPGCTDPVDNAVAVSERGTTLLLWARGCVPDATVTSPTFPTTAQAHRMEMDNDDDWACEG